MSHAGLELISQELSLTLEAIWIIDFECHSLAVDSHATYNLLWGQLPVRGVVILYHDLFIRVAHMTQESTVLVTCLDFSITFGNVDMCKCICLYVCL